MPIDQQNQSICVSSSKRVTNTALLSFASPVNSYRLVGSRIRSCEKNGWSGNPQCERKLWVFFFFFLHRCFIVCAVQSSFKCVSLQTFFPNSSNGLYTDVKTSLSLSACPSSFSFLVLFVINISLSFAN